MQFIDEVIGIPVVAQRQICVNRKVQKTTEDPLLQYTDGVVSVPVVLAMQVPLVQVVAEIVEIPLLLSDVQVPQVHVVVTETVEIPQSLFVEKTVMIPEIQTVQFPRTSESLTDEIIVAGKMDHETVVRGVAQDIQMDSFIEDLRSMASKGLSHHNCGGPFHVEHASAAHTRTSRRRERERKKTEERRSKGERQGCGRQGKMAERRKKEEKGWRRRGARKLE